jgi:hypothetical protein
MHATEAGRQGAAAALTISFVAMMQVTADLKQRLALLPHFLSWEEL